MDLPMTDNIYHGWSNWDTWDANLWLTNDEFSYHIVFELDDPDQIREFFLIQFRDISTDTGWIDGINPLRVNWQEIYDSLNEGEA
jgi:hypothetical protein